MRTGCEVGDDGAVGDAGPALPVVPEGVVSVSEDAALFGVACCTNGFFRGSRATCLRKLPSLERLTAGFVSPRSAAELLASSGFAGFGEGVPFSPPDLESTTGTAIKATIS